MIGLPRLMINRILNPIAYLNKITMTKIIQFSEEDRTSLLKRLAEVREDWILLAVDQLLKAADGNPGAKNLTVSDKPTIQGSDQNTSFEVVNLGETKAYRGGLPGFNLERLIEQHNKIKTPFDFETYLREGAELEWKETESIEQLLTDLN